MHFNYCTNAITALKCIIWSRQAFFIHVVKRVFGENSLLPHFRFILSFITCPNICPMYGLVQCTMYHHQEASRYNVFQRPVVFSKPMSFQTHCELSLTSVQHNILSESRFSFLLLYRCLEKHL